MAHSFTGWRPTVINKRDAAHWAGMQQKTAPSLVYPDGIGYCSAVSMRLTPLFSTARSSISKHVASSGALKSADAHRSGIPTENGRLRITTQGFKTIRTPYEHRWRFVCAPACRARLR